MGGGSLEVLSIDVASYFFYKVIYVVVYSLWLDNVSFIHKDI